MEQQQERQKRDQEQERYAKRFVNVPFEVMLDERLTLADKFVFGRALGFYEFFESVEKTAAFIGISIDQARKSKQKLERLGLIKCIHNDGRGKRYIAELDVSKMQLSDERQRRLEEKNNGVGEFSQSHWKNQPTYNKVIPKGDQSHSLKDKSFKEAQAPESNDEQLNEEPEEPVRYGKAEINDMLDYWQEQTGFSHHGTKAERYAINNLLRKNGYEATKALVRRVGTARRSDDQFAPQIAKPSQLQGKYSKLEALTMWEERQAKQTAAESAKPEGPRFDLLYPQFRSDEDDWLSSRDTPEAKAERQATVKRLREKYGFRRASSDNSEQAED